MVDGYVWFTWDNARITPDWLTSLTHVLSKPFSHHALILASSAKHFCTGLDTDWLHTLRQASFQQRCQAWSSVITCFKQLQHFEHPIYTLTHGACIGGGMGVIAASDVVIAHPQATFVLPEYTLGLLPIAITPLLLQTLGHTTYYAVWNKQLTLQEMQQMRLIHKVDSAPEACLKNCLKNHIAPIPTLAAHYKKHLRSYQKPLKTEDTSTMAIMWDDYFMKSPDGTVG
jgi:methylglutaconyl-CoA hydratase